ncbi:MAG: BTAD domain-containing putative transcriptional regulator, partial [Chloroflexota bacterium]
MALEKLLLFNGFRPFAADDQPITKFYSQKTKALLVYLLLEALDRPQTRSQLAGLLWPDHPDSRARRNLSQTLTSLRKDIGDQSSNQSLFHTTTQQITIDPQATPWVDVLEFQSKLTAVGAYGQEELTQNDESLAQLEQAADLYTGPLLDQFDVAQSDLFENWLLAKREHLQQQAVHVFNQLANGYAARGRLEEGLNVVDRLIHLAPWQESAHRQKMMLLAQQGQRIAALNQYEVLSDVLMAELGVPPSAETDELYDQIMAGDVERVVQTVVVAAQADPESAPVAPFQAPSFSPHFVGREDEIANIKNLLSDADSSGSPVALVGMGGVGKSTLAAHFTHLLKDQFDDGVL